MQKSIFPDKFRILSGSMLKLIAMISMLIDHIAHILVPVLPFMQTPFFAIAGREITLYWIMRKIGRLAFPIFCFLITEGYTHTRNKIKYGLSLLIFAVISEIPFNLMMRGTLFTLTYQNIFFTLFLGLLLIYILENTKNDFWKAIFMGVIVIVSIYLKADYGMKGALLILLMYLLRSHPAAQAILSYPMLAGGFAALTAFLPINLYNGQRGFIKSGALKYGFYLFYPLHIIVLVIIKFLLKQ